MKGDFWESRFTSTRGILIAHPHLKDQDFVTGVVPRQPGMQGHIKVGNGYIDQGGVQVDHALFIDM
jgi:hypothetical protein